MTALTDPKDTYLANFARFEEQLGSQPAWLRKIRRAGIERFAALGFPTLKDEEWRFTPLAPLTRVPFASAGTSKADAQAVTRAAFDPGPCLRLVFVNGHFAPAFSTLSALPAGVFAGSLAEILHRHPERVEPCLARYADHQSHPFIALNTAFLQDGAFISLPRGQVLETPIHLVFVASAAAAAMVNYPRNLIIAGANSQATVIESYVGLTDEVSFTNAVTEVIAAEGAVLDHCKLQRESRSAFHVATLQVQQGRSSNVSLHNIALGGRLVRNDINVVLADEGCECSLDGLYLAGGEQLIDNHTRIDHARPHCTSRQLYKGILDGKAHGVFGGRIYVHPDAQKTDARQTNQTLLLSEDAVIDTKPQLEIFADDVKCTHGATVGQLDAESIFYLRSRGLGKDEARGLLTFAFANDIMSRVKPEPLRERLESALLAVQHLSGGPAPREIE